MLVRFCLHDSVVGNVVSCLLSRCVCVCVVDEVVYSNSRWYSNVQRIRRSEVNIKDRNETI